MALTPNSVNTRENELLTILNSRLSQLNTAMPVEVLGVDTQQRTVSLRPLLSLIDNASQEVKYGVLSNVPYLRLQAGTCGLICDPQVGDKGLAVCCSRDISNVRHSTLPASHRQYSISDAVYVASLLYEEPKTYLKIENDTLTLTGNVIINGDVTITGNATVDGFSFEDHVHGNGNEGNNTTQPVR